MLDRMKEGLQNALKRILGATVLDEEAVKEFVRDFQRALLQADVNVRIVLKPLQRSKREPCPKHHLQAYQEKTIS